MPDHEQPQSSIILYQTEDGRTRIQCRFENDTIWLTQGELSRSRKAMIWKFRMVRPEGALTAGATYKESLQVRHIIETAV